jgi:hypothetical protein
MPRNIVIHYADKSSTVYENAPDSITPEQASIRAAKESGKKVVKVSEEEGYNAPAPISKAAPETSKTADFFKSIPSGIAQGAAGALGFVGDIGDVVNTIGDKITGATPEQNKQMTEMRKNSFIPEPPTSGQLNKKFSSAMGGYYEPKTTAGEYGKSIGTFAPAALTGGGGLMARALRVVAPAVGSEAAKQSVKGQWYEPIASVAGAVAGGGLNALREEGRNLAKIPAVDKLKKLASDAYKKSEDAGVVIKNTSYQDLIDNLTKSMSGEEISNVNQPGAFGALKQLSSHAGDLTLKKLDTLRQQVNAAMEGAKKSDKRLSLIMRDKIDDFISNLSVDDVTGDDPKVATTLLSTARDLWTKKARGEQIEELIRKAGLSASDSATAIRAQFRKLALNDRGMARFNKEQKEAIEQVAKGGPIGNLAGILGKLSPTKMGGGIGFGEFGLAQLDPRLWVLPAIGVAGNVASKEATKRSAALASALARSGKKTIDASAPFKSSSLAAVLASQNANDQNTP